MAELCGVSSRTVSYWKGGEYTIPERHARQLIALVGGRVLAEAWLLPDWWNNNDAGKKGAIAQVAVHGPLGTLEGRRLGGSNSYERRKNAPKDIFTPNIILEPRNTAALAELIGVLIGDGCVTKYQVSIATSSLVDYEYAQFVAQLIEQLFNVRPSLFKMKNSNCVNITVSSLRMVEFLVQKGIIRGNKLRQGLDIPDWVLRDDLFKEACLRGIFDTDGCIFQERHKINGKTYSYPRMAFVSMSRPLRESIRNALFDLGFEPKIRNNRSVNFERFTDITKYFKIVGSSNPKHISRFRSFGGVA